ncbi:EpsG family protein [Phocaeicola coprocola]|jgi:hypothetical protein|uniref:EpsG family protein n=1 Tax=Phocaeicola coprocola TaxID=310298 RepID=UPI003AF03BFD
MLGYFIFILLIYIVLTCKLPIKKRSILIFSILVIFSGIREGIGYDYYFYLDISDQNIGKRTVELIPTIIANIARITNPYLFFIYTSIIIYYLINKGITTVIRSQADYAVSIMLFISFPYFYFSSLGMVRQFLAISILFFGMCKYREKKIPLLLCVFLAFLNHQSTIIGVLLLIPWHKFSRKILFIFVLSSFIIQPILIEILNRIPVYNSVIGKMQQYIELADFFQGGRLVKLLVYALTFLSLIFYKKLTQNNTANKYYIGLVCLGCFFQNALDISPHMAIRICTCFFIAILVYIPQLIECLHLNKHLFIYLAIALLGINIYIQHIATFQERAQDPIGYSCAYPYRTYLF